jgi:hypothetical protein
MRSMLRLLFPRAFGCIHRSNSGFSVRLIWKALHYATAFFYGSGTWFTPDGDVANQVRDRKLAIAGSGQGVWSWVHIEAAEATVAALECPPGVYNIVDNDPSELSVWLPAFAAFGRAPA